MGLGIGTKKREEKRTERTSFCEQKEAKKLY
jgi:hypothetical protein